MRIVSFAPPHKIMNQISILILSCDSYADLWPAFFSFFWKYWPDCPYPVYMASNQKAFPDERVTSIYLGPDQGWARGAKKALESIPTKYVLLLLEDFLIYKKVDTEKIIKSSQEFIELGGSYLRLRPFPPPDQPVPAQNIFGQIEPGAPYMVALQAAIWEKDIFLALLKENETAWDMEIKGSLRASSLANKFYCAWQPLLVYTAAVTRGKWRISAIRLCDREGVALDLISRPVMTQGETLIRSIISLFGKTIAMFPWKVRRKIANRLRHLGLYQTRGKVE